MRHFKLNLLNAQINGLHFQVFAATKAGNGTVQTPQTDIIVSPGGIFGYVTFNENRHSTEDWKAYLAV